MNLALPQLSSCARSLAPVPQPLRVETLPWGREPDWSRFVADHPQGTLFHTLAWRNAVRDSFDHQCIYLVAINENQIAGVLPLFLVRGPVIGRMLVSVPYAVGGGILSNSREAGAALFLAAKKAVQDHKCAHIDFRSTTAHVPELDVIDRYVAFERELPDDSGLVLDWLPRKARAVVRNAQTKFRLQCDFEPDALPLVLELYCRNMRRLASINYPYRFFGQLAAQFGNRCWLNVVRHEGRPIAGLMSFTYRDRVIPYFFGCDTEARKYGAANFLYFRVMERATAEGLRLFDFGRSRRDNAGSCDFKRFHGFEAKPLAYQRFVPTSSRPVDLTPTNPTLGFIRRVWPHLPLAVTRPAGAMLSQYIPG